MLQNPFFFFNLLRIIALTKSLNHDLMFVACFPGQLIMLWKCRPYICGEIWEVQRNTLYVRICDIRGSEDDSLFLAANKR